MESKVKLIALYLPQFHEVDENNSWWGKGHTEWTNCRNAVPFGINHYQPKVPLNENYYNLLDGKSQEWQSQLALNHGIHAFCYYHYWFDGRLLLEKPAENMLKNSNIKINFCFSWANHDWENKIQRKNRKLLIKQTYGDISQWINHFNYLLKFFKDKRYIKVENKPMFIIYNIENIPNWPEMRNLWIKLAINSGFNGMYFVNTLKHENDPNFSLLYKFDAQFEYQPTFSMIKRKKFDYSWFIYYKRVLFKDFLNFPSSFYYDKIVNRSFKLTPSNGIKTFLGIFTDWDITARWKSRGMYLKGSTPKKFGIYLRKQIKRNKELYNSQFIFITAWNEWSEGAYLEPDQLNNLSYLNQIKSVILDED